MRYKVTRNCYQNDRYYVKGEFAEFPDDTELPPWFSRGARGAAPGPVMGVGESKRAGRPVGGNEQKEKTTNVHRERGDEGVPAAARE
jgi:hypothetical protein